MSDLHTKMLSAADRIKVVDSLLNGAAEVVRAVLLRLPREQRLGIIDDADVCLGCGSDLRGSDGSRAARCRSTTCYHRAER